MPAPKPLGPKIGGLPIYTKAQFRQVKPTGSYQGYVNYIKRRRGGGPKGTPNPYGSYEGLIGAVGKTYETPAQLEARAKRMAETEYSSQSKLLTEDVAQERKDAMERMQALSAAGRAAAGMNAGLFNAVGGEYNAAARELNALGSLSGGMAAQTQADVAAENASLANVGAPGVEAAGVMAGPGQAGVEQFRGATLGAENLGTQGQAATFGLAGMVSAQNLRATQEAAAAFRQADKEITKNRALAIRELSAGRTDSAGKYLLQLQESQRQQMALAMGLISARGEAGQQSYENRVAASATAEEKRRYAAEQAAKKTEKAEEQRRWEAEYDIAAEDAKLKNKLARIEIAKGGTGGKSGPQATAEFLAGLAESSLDPDFQYSLASIFYSRPYPAKGQPPKGSQGYRDRVNAVRNYFLRTVWPQLELNYIPANRKAAKADFTQKLSAWFNATPMPDFDIWRAQALKPK